MNIRPANEADFIAIVSLLESAVLLTSDLSREMLEHFFVGASAKEIYAAGGLEIYDTIALLRSVVVAKEFRGQNVAADILKGLLKYAQEQQVKQLYLLTESAPGFFAKHGFHITDRKAVPHAIRNTSQFSNLCPADATVMRLDIEKT